MPTYVSLLRGINVGGRRKVLMADLKVIYQKLGFTQVITYIQSGNVVFEAKKSLSTQVIEEVIKLAIQKKYDFDVPVLIRKVEEITTIYKTNPFLSNADKIERLYVAFLSDSPIKENIEKLFAMNFDGDKFEIVSKHIFINYIEKYSTSKLTNNLIESKLKVRATTRNWKTVTKLVEISSEQ